MHLDHAYHKSVHGHAQSEKLGPLGVCYCSEHDDSQTEAYDDNEKDFHSCSVAGPVWAVVFGIIPIHNITSWMGTEAEFSRN